MSGRGDYHGVRSGEKRKAEIDEATLGVAPKLPKTKTEKDTYASPPVRPGVVPTKNGIIVCEADSMRPHARIRATCECA